MDREVELQAIAGLKRGDGSAFDVVYEEYRRRLFSFALRLTGTRDAAEEIAQETWMRLAARAGKLRDDTSLAPWLFTVVRNLCVSFWRSRGRISFGWESPGYLDVLNADGCSPERDAEASDLRRRLELALARLPVTYREVLLLVGVEGLTPGEAAVICGVRPEALRKRLERARDMLAAELGMERRRITHGSEVSHGRTNRKG
jgi:RNA polymerase sigma-70 factor (ECF subfamily)